MTRFQYAPQVLPQCLILISLIVVLTIVIKLKQASRMGPLAVRHQILCWLYMVLWPIFKIQDFLNRHQHGTRL